MGKPWDFEDFGDVGSLSSGQNFQNPQNPRKQKVYVTGPSSDIRMLSRCPVLARGLVSETFGYFVDLGHHHPNHPEREREKERKTKRKRWNPPPDNLYPQKE